MSLTTAQLVANISVVGASEAQSALSNVSSSVDKTGGILKSGLGAALGVAAGIGTAAIGGLTAVLADSVKVAMQHQQVMSQTTQVLKSTKDASGETAQSISDMSEALSKTTMFSQDTIQAGQNLLLTFTGIGKNVFPQTTQAMLDLSQATGQSLTSSAMQLGKALNDPLKGMSALQRVGVSFSASEQEQIKTMMAHNDVMGAQQVMLKELETEFGGSAAAAGKTFAGQIAILKNNFEDLKEKIGTAILPILSQFLSIASSIALPILSKLSDWFTKTAIPAFQGFMQQLSPLGTLLTYVGQLGMTAFNNLSGIFSQVGNLIGQVTGSFTNFGNKFPSVSQIIKSIGPAITQPFLDLNNMLLRVQSAFNLINIRPLAQGIQSAMSSIDFSGLTKGAGSISKSIQGMLSDAFSSKNLNSAMQGINGFMSLLGKVIGSVDFKGIEDGAKTLFQDIMNISPAVNLFQSLSDHAQDIGKWFTSSVVPALKQAQPAFGNLMSSIGGLLPVITTISQVIHNVFQAAFDALLPVFMKVIPIIIQIAGIIANLLGNAIKFLTPYIIQATQAIGQFAADILQRVSPIIVQFFGNLQQDLNDFMKTWNTIWPYLAPFLQGLWDDLVGIVKIAWALLSGIINIGLDLLSGNWTQAWTDLKTMLSGIWDGITTIIKGGINDMIGVLNLGIAALNSFIDAVENALDSAASALGLGKPLPITSIPTIPTYASGTPAGGHPGGPAIVGEKGPELVMLPAGSSVLNASATKGVLSGVPGYAGGTGNALQDLMNWAAGGAKSILDNIMKGIQIPNVLGSTLNLGQGVANNLEESITKWINTHLLPKIQQQQSTSSGATAGPGQAVNVPGSLMDWIMQAISLTGVPSNWANDLAIIAMHESGGNPNAINNWDINAQEGHPSQGIMQTIPSTFAAHMVAGHGNILNPIDNIAAAIGYIKGRYGSVFNVPGIVSMSQGGAYVGYASGTDFAEGGLSWVGENGKELMYVPRGAQIAPHESLNKFSQPQQISVQSPVYLDGRLLINGLMPHMVNTIRYNTGSFNI